MMSIRGWHCVHANDMGFQVCGDMVFCTNDVHQRVARISESVERRTAVLVRRNAFAVEERCKPEMKHGPKLETPTQNSKAWTHLFSRYVPCHPLIFYAFNSALTSRGLLLKHFLYSKFGLTLLSPSLSNALSPHYNVKMENKLCHSSLYVV